MTGDPASTPGSVLRRLLAEGGGKVSFERFMEAALYHPEVGYYTRAIPTVGRRGDFSTAATLDPALGRALATWARSRRRELLPRGRWHLIEIGGGSGHLARGVLSALGLSGRLRLTYHVVEVSPALRALQEKRLRRLRVRWHGTVEEALAAAGGRALIFSNELVDAFPVKLLVLWQGRWREVFLTVRDGRLTETFEPLTDPRLTSPLCSLPGGFSAPPEGQRCEVRLGYHDWLAAWVPRWRRGALLTLDYGDLAGGLYERRKGGTLRAYFRHFRFAGAEVYERFARQDLTADVNFTDLRRWGEELGLGTRFYGTQRQWLLRWNPRLARARSPAAELLLHPEGAGGAFKVLEQSREVIS